jgi:CheY-like chemotaxis protein
MKRAIKVPVPAEPALPGRAEEQLAPTRTRKQSGWMARVARPFVVLIAEDDEDGREIYARVLENSGFRVLKAENGAVAIHMAVSHEPDVILMDLDMPVMGGVEAIERLKSDDRTRAIPVVVLSGSTATNHVRAEHAGCAAYLMKPCVANDLEGVVRSIAMLSRV